METYSMDLRQRVVADCDRKTGTQQEIAKRFSVSLAWVQKLLRLRRTCGSFAPKPHGGGRRPKFEGARLAELKALVEQEPDATLQELLERSKVPASIMAVQRALQRLGSRLKKSRCAPRNRIART